MMFASQVSFCGCYSNNSTVAKLRGNLGFVKLGGRFPGSWIIGEIVRSSTYNIDTL